MSLIPPRPGGSPDELGRAATVWAMTSSDIRDLRPALDGAVGQIRWDGPAADAFFRSWHEFRSTLGPGAEAYHSEAMALHRVGEQILDAQHQWDRAMAAMAIAGVVSLGLAAFTFGTSVVADAAGVAAEAGLMTALAETLAETLNVEVAAMTALIEAAASLSARWLVMFSSQVAGEVTFNTITRGDANPLDADLGAAAVVATALTTVPLGLARLARGSPLPAPELMLRFAEGFGIEAILQTVLGKGDISWLEAATLGGGGTVFLGKLAPQATPRGSSASDHAGRGRGG